MYKMKSIAAILAVLLVYANAVEDNEVLQQWTDFQAQFGKTYRSPIEARKRFLIFKSNLELIEAHNNLFEQGLTTYTMGTNQFADWTQSEFEQSMNTGLLNRTRIQSDEFFVKTPGFVAPESVDWRQKGLVTPVKDQRSCGGCWAFSTTGALEGQLAQTSAGLVSLSEQQLIDCSKEGGNNGCSGGLMTAAYDYVHENGISSETDYPYEEIDGDCRANQSTPVTKVSGYVNIPSGDEAALVEAITTQGPISVGVDSTNFHFYKSGIFTGRCSSTNLHHAILAVGYGSENGQEYYIVKNSWGATWGEEGYIRIPKNSNNKCGIATDATYPEI